jgi:hypothetical protein
VGANASLRGAGFREIQSGSYNLLREVTVDIVIDRPNGFLKGC